MQRLRTLAFTMALILPSTAQAKPQQLSVRATGLFMDHEFELNSGPGLNFTIAGLELGWVASSGLALEVGGEMLIGLAGPGWAGVVRGGWQYPLHGRAGERNRWLGTLTPLAGVRVGRIPWSGTSDGYNLATFAVGPQGALAYDIGRVGPRIGYTLRVFSALNYRALNRQLPDASSWAYANGDPARFSVELGLSVGISLPVSGQSR